MVFQVGPRVYYALEGQTGEVVDAYGVVEAGVLRSGEGVEGEAELADPLKARHCCGLQKLPDRFVHWDVPPDAVPNLACGAPEELPYRATHTALDPLATKRLGLAIQGRAFGGILTEKGFILVALATVH